MIQRRILLRRAEDVHVSANALMFGSLCFVLFFIDMLTYVGALIVQILKHVDQIWRSHSHTVHFSYDQNTKSV